VRAARAAWQNIHRGELGIGIRKPQQHLAAIVRRMLHGLGLDALFLEEP